MFLNQLAYIHQILACFDIQNTSPVLTPLVVKHKLSTSQSSQTKAKKCVYRDYGDNIHYLSLVGSLPFMTQTHSNIQFAVSLVAQFGKNFGIMYLKAMKHILYYLKSMADLNLVLEQYGKDNFDLVGWTDLYWAQNTDDWRFVGGFIFDVTNSFILWFFKKQPTIATFFC